VLKEASIEPPIQAAYFLCKAADTLISVLAFYSARERISLSNLSVKPFINVDPPASTILLYRLIFKSLSHFSMAWYAIEAMPG